MTPRRVLSTENRHVMPAHRPLLCPQKKMSELIAKLELSWNVMAAKLQELSIEIENLREDNLVLQARNRTMRAQIQNLQDEVEELELSLIVDVVSTD